MASRLIYIMPEGKFTKMQKDSIRDTKYIDIPFLIIMYSIFAWNVVGQLSATTTYHGIPEPIYAFLAWTFLGSLAFLGVYLCDFMTAFKHKRLKIYTDGLVPSIVPFWYFTFKDVFVPYDRIEKIELIKHPKFKDIYKFIIYDNRGRKFKIDSRWLYMYKVREKDILKIRELLIKIKDELEKEENREKRKRGSKIELFVEGS